MVSCPLVSSLLLVSQGLGAEKLNAPLDYRVVQGDVSALEGTPDGAWIAYVAQQEEATPSLYVVKRDGSVGPVRVSPPGTELDGFAINRQATRVVFRTLARTQLFSAAPGGALTQLNPPLVSGGAIHRFQLGPNGLFAVYVADQEVDGRNDLYGVPLFGAPIVRKLGESVEAFSITSDGLRVLFTTPQNGSRARLFSAPVDGSAAAVPLSANLPTESRVIGFDLEPNASPGGGRAAFLVEASNKRELYSAPLDGSAPAVKLSGQIVTNGDVSSFELAPAGGRVVFRADAVASGQWELFSVPIDGSSARVLLSGGHEPVGDFAISPTGLVVAFEAEVRGRMWSAPSDGSVSPLQLTTQAGGGGSTLGVRDLVIGPDSTRALYVVSSSGSFPDELRSVPLDASAPDVRICHALTVNDPLRRYAVEPDGTVVYLASAWPTPPSLYQAPQDGATAPVALHPSPLGWPGTAEDFAVAGGNAYFLSNLAGAEVQELFAAPTDGSAAPLRLNGELFWTRGFRDVQQIGVSADGRHAAYATEGGLFRLALATPGAAVTVAVPGSFPFLDVDLDSHPTRFYWHALTTGGYTLFAAPFDGSAPPQQLGTGAESRGHALTPDARWLVFGTSDYFGPSWTYLVPGDVSAPATALSSPFVLAFHANRSGTRLLYRLHEYNPFVDTPTGIHLRDTTSGGTSFEIAPPAGVPWNPAVQAEAFTADDARILFVRDQEVEGKLELYSVLPASGATPVKLSGALPATGDVAPGFAPTPDGTRVVFAADRDVDGALQLFVSPVDGSAAPLELSPALAAGESVGVDAAGAPLVWVTADSSRALFVLDGAAERLLGVPLDGSTPAAAVGPLPPPAGGLPLELGAVQLARGRQIAVYRAALTEPGRFELFAAPVAGGPAVRLAATPGVAQDVEPGFVVLRSGREVLFRGDLAADERQELWLVPVDAGRPPRRVSALGLHDADVEPDFVLAADQDHVYYRADAEHDGEIEFFRHPLRTPAVRR